MKRPMNVYRGKEPYIFISYSHKNNGQAADLISTLQSDGFRVWFDEGIDPGTEWDENIASHIENCSFFIALLSKDYLESSNCNDEIYYARELEKKRLLIYLEDVELPGKMKMRLGRLQAIHLYKYNDISRFYSKLYDAEEIWKCCEKHENPLNDHPENSGLRKKKSYSHSSVKPEEVPTYNSGTPAAEPKDNIGDFIDALLDTDTEMRRSAVSDDPIKRIDEEVENLKRKIRELSDNSTPSKTKAHVVFAVDTSGSMMGTRIAALNSGLRNVLVKLNAEYASAVEFSVLQYHSIVFWRSLSDLPLSAGGITNTGAALKVLNDKLTKLPENQFCVVILITDGFASDSCDAILSRIKNENWYQRGARRGISIGEEADIKLLEDFTGDINNVYCLRNGYTDRLPDLMEKSVRSAFEELSFQPA